MLALGGSRETSQPSGVSQLCSLREERLTLTGLHSGTAPGSGIPLMDGVSRVAKPFMTRCGQS